MDEVDRVLRMAEAAVTRLCHDLSGALGTVLNAVDLAMSGDALGGEAIQLAGEAAREANARLRLARAAWGLEEPLTSGALTLLAEGLPNRTRMRLDLSNLAAGAADAAGGRVLLFMLKAAAEALHGPGSLSVAGDLGAEVFIVIEGIRAAWPPALTTLLIDPGGSVEREHLSIRAASLLAARAGIGVSMLHPTGAGSGPSPLLLDLDPRSRVQRRAAESRS